MRSYLFIKGKNLWKLCALIVLVIVISCCGTTITEIDQPSTATVGQTMPISITVSYCNPSDDAGNLVVALLLPNGWNASKNMTMTYTSGVGNGTLKQIPSTAVEKQSGLPWPTALKNKFGLAGNYVNDMQWVAFQSDKAYTFSSVTSPVTVNIQLKVGADNNNADVSIAYLFAETNNGLQDPTDGHADCSSYEYYELRNGPRLSVTGGTGSYIDYADPQLSSVDPAKALIDDYITINFNGDIQQTALLNQQQIYMQATAYTTDGTAYNVSGTTSKNTMTETAAGSNVYSISLWPRQYFGIPAGATLDRIEYVFTDKTGTLTVNNGGAGEFIYKFTCASN